MPKKLGSYRLKYILKDIKSMVRRCCEYFNYRHEVKIRTIPDEDFDIRCLPLIYPAEIHIGKKWFIAYEVHPPEGLKRIVHEMLHIAFKYPDNIDYLQYYSQPWRDAFSKTVYEDIQKYKHFDIERVLRKLESNMLDPEWVEELYKYGRLGW